jgi:hypothetical protein
MKDAIVDSVTELLRGHEKDARGFSMRGSIHQEPYKGDFFRIFADSFNQSGKHLTADELADAVADREPELVADKTWQEMYRFWSEWTYAWKHLGMRHVMVEDDKDE